MSDIKRSRRRTEDRTAVVSWRTLPW